MILLVNPAYYRFQLLEQDYVPLSLLATGTTEDVKACCKRLIDVVGKGGGYIMDASTGLEDAKPENVKALFEFTRSYGVY